LIENQTAEAEIKQMNSPAQPIQFTPAPSAASAIIAGFSDPATSLVTIAADHNTTLEALLLWASHPEIRERLARIDSIAMDRTRLAVASSLHTAIHALVTMLDGYIRDENSNPSAADAETGGTHAGASARNTASRQAPRNQARLAAWLLYRLRSGDPPRSRRPFTSAQAPAAHTHESTHQTTPLPAPARPTPFRPIHLTSDATALQRGMSFSSDSASASTSAQPNDHTPLSRKEMLAFLTDITADLPGVNPNDILSFITDSKLAHAPSQQSPVEVRIRPVANSSPSPRHARAPEHRLDPDRGRDQGSESPVPTLASFATPSLDLTYPLQPRTTRDLPRTPRQLLRLVGAPP
jgi:hypothetical protein